MGELTIRSLKLKSEGGWVNISDEVWDCRGFQKGWWWKSHCRSLRSQFEKVLLSLKKKLNKPERVQVNKIIILLRFFTSSFYFLVRGDMFRPCFLQMIIFSNYELQEILQIYYNFPLIFPHTRAIWQPFFSYNFSLIKLSTRILTLYTLKSVRIFFILFSMHFLLCWQWHFFNNQELL